ncbi:MAG: Flp pilus assembly protein CpaB [Gemmataceae bacterium]|nr:Flp pilus assembly protein CpaB [Gemmataceae bacterium]
MRASTLFAITVAILLALGVAVAARYSGFFDSQPPPVKKTPVYQILVANQNLFEGITISGADVRVRDVRDEEMRQYLDNKDRYLPPVPMVANYRVLARNVLADEPLRKEDFKELKLATPLHLRLGPFMRAVSVSVPKERAAGGMIQTGEHVDVMLTTQITCPEGTCYHPAVETAVIARNLRVIAKRNSLWTVLAPLPEDGLLQFTLEANPYRAALIEFARLKGDITLVPTPSAQVRDPAVIKGGGRPTFSDPENREYKDEDLRVDAILGSDLTVGDPDLERIFNLKPLPPKVPPLRVERFSDVKAVAPAVFSSGGGPLNGSGTTIRTAAALASNGGGGYLFGPPGGSTPRTAADCPTCRQTSPRR